MFLNKTVFILGAGASWHYGYPTGEDLVREVLAKARVLQDYCSGMYRSDDLYAVEQLPRYLTRNSGPSFTDGVVGMKRAWNAGVMEADALIQRLSAVDPIVIDYFLGHNPDLKDIGKFLIAWVLLECEADYVFKNGNPNRYKMLAGSPDGEIAYRGTLSLYKDNWYRFLIHKLTVGCSSDTDLLTKNDVKFITFNYDVSLEYRLFKGLSAISKFEKMGVVNEFMTADRFRHVYGKIRENPFADPLDFDRKLSSFQLDPLDSGDGSSRSYKNFFDNIYAASQEIRTVAPEEKTFEGFDSVQRDIAEANCIYILGYGFDSINNELLDIRSATQKNKFRARYVLFTNFLNGGVVNKRASSALLGRPGAFTGDYFTFEAPNEQIYCEKSIRDVYGALSLDFGAPEEAPDATALSEPPEAA